MVFQWILGIIPLLMLLSRKNLYRVWNGFRTPDKQIKAFFEKRRVGFAIRRSVYHGDSVRYIVTYQRGSGQKRPVIIFVHGAPGSSDVFYRYLADPVLLEHAKMISIDRLGYGYSGYGNARMSISEQAGLVAHIVELEAVSRVFLVGHSYGGPIIVNYAACHPDKTAGLLLISPVHDPEGEKIFWFSYPAYWRLTKWLMPAALQVAGKEKFSHAAELKKMERKWERLTMKITHFHGTKDTIAPPCNIDFTKRKVPSRQLKLIMVSGAGHYIVWDHFPLVKKELLQLLNDE